MYRIWATGPIAPGDTGTLIEALPTPFGGVVGRLEKRFNVSVLFNMSLGRTFINGLLK